MCCEFANYFILTNIYMYYIIEEMTTKNTYCFLLDTLKYLIFLDG